jgi:hypothetical protein
MRVGVLAGFILASLELSGCTDMAERLSGASSAVLNPNETLSLESDPPGAACRLLRGSEDLGKVSTPGRIEVTPSQDDILVLCEKPHYQTAAAVLHADAARPGGAAGSVAGWPSDMRQSPHYRYPPVVRLQLTARP